MIHPDEVFPYYRIDDRNLYLVNADGSSMQRVTAGPEYELLIGWLPEGQTLAYVFLGPEGLQLRFLDLITGAHRDGFVINAKGANAAISPDGQKIAFVERVMGGMDYGLYVAQLDGSDRRLIAQLDHMGLSNPLWSPDGTWLIVGITYPAQLNSGVVTALINPATCEAVPLEGIEGHVQDWSR
jgi:Tol biopolymer transport system component